MKKANLALILFSCFFAITVVNGQFWNRTNPGGGGWMMAVGAGPTGTILVGSDLSGAYKSTDGGQRWEVIGNASGLTATHVGAIGFDPVDGDVFYLGTNQGIFRSEDGGDTLIHVFNPTVSGGAVNDIKISRENTNIGYAAYHPAWNGFDAVVYKTIDHGLNWSPVSLDLPDNLRLLKVLIDPNDAERVYVLSGFDRFACGPAELYRSKNGGLNWTKLAPAISDTISIMDVALDPLNPTTIYLTTMNVSCGSGLSYEGDIFKSIDGGDNWFDPNPAIEKSGVLWIKEDDPSLIRLIDVRKTAPWIPSSGTFTSMDSGITWTQTGFETDWGTGYLAEFNSDLGTVIHRSYGSNGNYCKTLGADMSDPDKMYWVNTRFVFGTKDGGTLFANLFTDQDSSGGWQSRGVDNVVLFDIEISEADPNIIYAGYADNGLWRSLDAGGSWQSCNPAAFTAGWDGFGGNAYCVAPDPTRANVVWAAMRGTNICQLVRSDSAGAITSWKLSDAGLPTSSRITDLSVDPNSDPGKRTLFSVVSQDIYKSTDDGYNWNLSYDSDGLWFVEVDPSDGAIIYAGGSSGFFRSTDGGISWSETGLSEMSEAGNTVDFWRKTYRGVSCIHPSTCEPGQVYVTVYGPGKGLYKSTDYGASWFKLNEGNHMRSVAVSENNHQVLFTGSSYVGYSGGVAHSDFIGFQYSLDGGATWIVDDAELAYPSMVDLELNHANPEKLFAASQGTGIQWAYDWIVPFTYYADRDNDTFGDPDHAIDTCSSLVPLGYVENDQDCDDTEAGVNPDAVEIPDNGIDEDCDGLDLITVSESLKPEVELKLFPSPFQNEITISAESNLQVQMEIISSLGQSVLKKEIQLNKQGTKLDLSSLPLGGYWVKIYKKDGVLLSIKQLLKIE